MSELGKGKKVESNKKPVKKKAVNKPVKKSVVPEAVPEVVLGNNPDPIPTKDDSYDSVKLDLNLEDEVGKWVKPEPEEEEEEVKPVELTYQDRVIAEHRSLELKVNALEAFINTAKFRALSRSERLDLSSQLKAMNKYLTVLCRRVCKF
jgi:hypothetical protein